MRPIDTDVARSVVCLSPCWTHRWPLQRRLNRSRFRLGQNRVTPRNHARVRWANTTEPSVRGGDGALRQFTPTTCYCYNSRYARSSSFIQLVKRIVSKVVQSKNLSFEHPRTRPIVLPGSLKWSGIVTSGYNSKWLFRSARRLEASIV